VDVIKIVEGKETYSLQRRVRVEVERKEYFFNCFSDVEHVVCVCRPPKIHRLFCASPW